MKWSLSSRKERKPHLLASKERILRTTATKKTLLILQNDRKRAYLFVTEGCDFIRFILDLVPLIRSKTATVQKTKQPTNSKQLSAKNPFISKNLNGKRKREGEEEESHSIAEDEAHDAAVERYRRHSYLILEETNTENRTKIELYTCIRFDVLVTWRQRTTVNRMRLPVNHCQSMWSISHVYCNIDFSLYFLCSMNACRKFPCSGPDKDLIEMVERDILDKTPNVHWSDIAGEGLRVEYCLVISTS